MMAWHEQLEHVFQWSAAHLPDMEEVAAHLSIGAGVSLLICLLLARRWRQLASGQEATAFDRRLSERFRERRTPGLTRLARVLAALGSPPLMVSLALVGTIAGVFFRPIRGAAWTLPIAIVGAALLIQALKMEFHRPRPALFQPLLQETGYSFPSGHSLIAVVVYGLLGFFVMHFFDLDAWDLAVGGFVAGLVFLIGMARVYVGVHYASDVFTGWTAGLPWLVACLWLGKALSHGWHQAGEPFLRLGLDVMKGTSGCG